MDNFFQNCPAMMEDNGRFLTEFRSDVLVNENIKNIRKIWRDDEYRCFLQSNGKKILDKQWDFYKQKNLCKTQNCAHVYPLRQSPSTFAQEMHNSNANLKSGDKNANRCPHYNDYRINPNY